MDLSVVTTKMGELVADMGTIGGLLIVAAVAALAIRWTKAQFF